MKFTPKQFLIIGFFLVTYGMVIPWLMVLQIVKATYFLSFTSYAATFAGLLFGTVGISTYFRDKRRKP